MLLRFAALRGVPSTPAEWEAYRAWKLAQMAAPECRMTDLDVALGELTCPGCPGKPQCPRKL